VTNPVVDPMIGRTIAQYEILARRGGGGMGVVYEARDTKLGRRVALKFLPPQWSHDEAAKQRFVREAQAASATDHPNICTIHDVATTADGQLFIVMAYYPGETLKQRLAGGPLPLHDALDIATQVADGLAKAHANGVVHRDIKPGNIILTEDGVRIVDFGLATFADALQLTVPGSTLGTAAYMSPEQSRGEEADARADVWAVGVILYEMLAGRVPFRGAYAEAIAYAIRNDAPAPLRERRPEVPEDVEQLVFRALHKDPAIRYQNGRELARALRQARGFTVPMDLRTQPVDVRHSALASSQTKRLPRRSARPLATALALPVLLVIAALAWLLWPIPRIEVLIAPLANETGFREVEPYRLALTQAIIARLADSRDVRPVPYGRMLPALRSFIDDEDVSGISSREAIQAVAKHAGVPVIVVPTLLYENGEWRARVEFQNAETTADIGLLPYESESATSSLPPVTSYQLVSGLVDGIEDRFKSTRSRALDLIAAPILADGEAGDNFLKSHVAALEFERALRAYEALVYAAAARALATAEQHEPDHPLPAVWRSRVAILMGERQVAIDAASRAIGLITDRTRRTDLLLAEAAESEARGDSETAARKYRALASEFPDEPTWAAELGAFLARRGDIDGAVTVYHGALAADPGFIRPRLELCRLYDSTRKNQPELAIKFGEQARTMSIGLSDRLGEAQALLCLADILRSDDRRRQEAERYVDDALAIFKGRSATYNVARALQYAALVRGFGDLRTAVRFWEQSLAAAEAAGNTGLQAGVASNLGVAHESMGNFARALKYYQQSYRVSEARRDERFAAYNQANAGALRISNGIDPDQGVRDVQNALAVVRRLKDRNFELLCLQALAAFYRFTGQYAPAEQELNRAAAIAAELGETDDISAVSLQRARLHLDAGNYTAALKTLNEVLEHGSAQRRGEASLLLGRAYTRVGDFAAAKDMLGRAATEIDARGASGFLPALHLALGELALESGQADVARTEFTSAASFWRDDLPVAASVEAHGYLGLMDADRGRVSEGQSAISRSLQQAERMRIVALEARCRLFLARLALRARRSAEAIGALSDVPLDRVGLELQALVHAALARSRAADGDDAGSERDADAARRAVTALVQQIPEQYRSRFQARPDIMAVVR
jgi:tetratricopeptide (TPR) repeat protein